MSNEPTVQPESAAESPPSAARRSRRTANPWLMLGSVVLILALGGGVAALLVMGKTAPPRDEAGAVGPLVEAVVVRRDDVDVQVTGHGTVEPRIAIDIVPQVSGKVIEVHPELTAGGRVPANATLIRIDPSDYELAVQRAEAALAQARGGVQTATAALRRAETALEVEQAEAEVAIEEWRKSEGDKPVPALLARRPQIRERQADVASATAQLASANAAVQSAEATLAEAKLALERTRISVPFAGRVTRESVDVGQYVTAGQSLAYVYSTDVARIVVPFRDEQLRWFNVPGSTLDPSPSSGSAATAPPDVTVSAEFAGQRRAWQGRVARTTGEVDRASRMVHVVIEVDDPFDPANAVPLVPGMFVEVTINGHRLEDVVRLPRIAVRPDDQVWVARDGKLRVVGVTVHRTDRNHAYVTGGVRDGDVVITTQLDVAIDGMAVRVPDDMLTETPAPATARTDIDDVVSPRTQ